MASITTSAADTVVTQSEDRNPMYPANPCIDFRSRSVDTFIHAVITHFVFSSQPRAYSILKPIPITTRATPHPATRFTSAPPVLSAIVALAALLLGGTLGDATVSVALASVDIVLGTTPTVVLFP
jgi:hypothetical protein